MIEGVNPITHDIILDSGWDKKYSKINAGNCSEYDSDEYIYNDGYDSIVDMQYVPITNTTCAGVSVPGDTNHTVIFSNSGTVQEPFFESENIVCSPSSSSCAANWSLTISSQKYANFKPTNGQSGTSSGKVRAFLYNYNSLNFSASGGNGGIAGLANMTVPNTIAKYCVAKRDLTTDGASSAYAKTPDIKMHKILWTPYTQGVNGKPGTSYNNTVKSYVIKGLDASQIMWLGSDNVLGFGL